MRVLTYHVCDVGVALNLFEFGVHLLLGDAADTLKNVVALRVEIALVIVMNRLTQGRQDFVGKVT